MKLEELFASQSANPPIRVSEKVSSGTIPPPQNVQNLHPFLLLFVYLLVLSTLALPSSHLTVQLEYLI